MTETRPYVDWKLMNDFMVDVFEKYGVPREDGAICADVLLESDRRGIESHGCNRFKPIYLDRIKNGTLLPRTEIEIVKESPTTVVMDAHNGMGMVASHKMMEMLIDKAGKYGMAGGTIFNSTHYGIAGYWTTMASKAGMIGISGTNARPSVAPTFGVEPMMGTNPMTFTMPTDEEFDFNLDCATCIIQNGKIEFYERMGKPTPEGCVITKDGSVPTDSGDAQGQRRPASSGRTGRGDGRIQGLWLHNRGGDPVLSPVGRSLYEGSERCVRRRKPSDVPAGTFLLCDQSGILHGARYLQEDCGRHLQRPAGFSERARSGPHLYCGREGMAVLAGPQGQGRSGRGFHSERTDPAA